MALLLVGASPAILTDHAAHSHDCYEIILNVEGDGIAEIGGAEHPFSRGTIHVVPPSTLHSKRAAQGFRDLYLHTDSLLRTEFSAQKEFVQKEPILLSDDACHTMESILNILLSRYLLDPDPDDITKALYNIVLRLVEEWSRHTPSDPVVDELIHTIATSYNDPEFEVTKALTNTGYSKDHLRRRFRQATGMTPNAYLKSVRIRYAKSLLLQKEKLHLPVNQIALLCGYYDAAYFCRSFRKETGMTPSEFVQSAQKQL